MRILMLAPTPFFSDRGCHIRILNSYLRLKRKKNTIDLVTYSLGRTLLGIKPFRISSLPGYKKTDPGFSIYKPFLDIKLYFLAKKLIKKNSYDYIYAHLHEGALIGIFLRKKFGLKVVFDAQGSLTGELIAHKTINKKGLVYKIIWNLEKYICQNSNEIITSTQNLKKFIKDNFDVSGIKVIEDIPDKSIFNKNVKPANLKLPKGKKIVVYLGGLQKYKGIDHLIKAIPYVDEKFHFLIMGYPVEYARELAKSLGVMDRITFTGKIPYEKAASYLKLGDIAVSPKTLESGEANSKLYNYLAMDLKVACIDTPENRKMLKDKGLYANQKTTFKNIFNKIKFYEQI